jgi:nitroreductase
MDPSSMLFFISRRYSPFVFAEKMLGDNDMNLLFEAAGKAPSSFNDQPWCFLYASKNDQEHYELFYECLNEGNMKWAHSAPVLALSMTRKLYSRNKHENAMAKYEAGMAVGNLLTQAMSMGIYVHQMGGYDKELARLNLDIPDDIDILTMMAIGYPGNVKSLPEDLKERASKRTTRRPVDHFVFKGAYPKI